MMTMRPTRTLFTALGAALAFALAAAGSVRADESIGKSVALGVDLLQTIVGSGEPGGPLMVHAVIVDPQTAGIRLASALGGDTVEEQPGNGMEAVNRQVARTGAIDGLNADFFPFTGDPLGLSIQKGELVSESLGSRGALGIRADGSIVIGRPAFSGSVAAEGGAERPLAGLNRKPGSGELVLFAPVYGDSTPEKAATLVTLDAGGAVPGLREPLRATVVSVLEAAGKVAIPKDRLILSGDGAAAAWLRANAVPGKALTFRFNLTDQGKDWSGVVEAVAGGPVLLANGKPDLRLDVEKIGQDFSTTRHPRSAVGVTKDGKALLVAVDGRQILSRGASLPELTEQMARLGAIDALNLDGGGSTCLTVRGLVINSPSDGQVRRVANSLLVFGKAPLAPPKEVDESAPKPESAAGPRWPAVIPVTSGQQWSGNLARSPEGMLPLQIFGTRNGAAFVSQNGIVHGYRAGKAEALALVPIGDTVRRWAVEVSPGPPAKMLVASKEGVLEVTIRDVNNNGLTDQTVWVKGSDGKAPEAVTGEGGVARIPAEWMKSTVLPVTIVSGVRTMAWPDGISPVPPAGPAAAATGGK